MAELFGRNDIVIKHPITADMATLSWGDDGSSGVASESVIVSATNISIQYQQPIIKRRTLGAGAQNIAVLIPGQPQGQFSMQRLVADTEDNLFDLPGFNICKGTATIILSFNGATQFSGCSTTNGFIYTMSGAIVAGYNLSAESEGMTVVDGIQVEFLQLGKPAQALGPGF